MLEFPWEHEYDFICGLEVHIQLNTASKIFSTDKNNFGDKPNANVGIVTAGLPGSLPRLNGKVLEKAILIGLACNCEINRNSYFERKHYFYPDLPKGYQITQMNEPICIGGGLKIEVKSSSKFISFDHIHLEEDAGKSVHDIDDLHSHIDLNRAGAPLLELVTEPVITHPEEVHAFLLELRTLVRILKISDGDMEKGSLRCDANVSLKPKSSKTLGNRTEIKNLNSMNFARKAVVAEANRQFQILQSGGQVNMQTMGYDVENDTTFPLREKEMAHDYRYLPDPDLPVIHIEDSFISKIQSEMPELPDEIIQRLQREYSISEYLAIEISKDPEVLCYFESAAKETNVYSGLANWLVGDVKAWLNENGKIMSEFEVLPKNLAALVTLIKKGMLSKSLATSQVFPLMIEHSHLSPHQIMENHNLVAVDDEKEIGSLVIEVLNEFPEKVDAYRKGKKGLMGFFIGEVMKRTGMKANPKKVADIAKRMLV